MEESFKSTCFYTPPKKLRSTKSELDLDFSIEKEEEFQELNCSTVQSLFEKYDPLTECVFVSANRKSFSNREKSVREVEVMVPEVELMVPEDEDEQY